MNPYYAFIVAPNQKWLLPLGSRFELESADDLTLISDEKFLSNFVFKFNSAAKLYLWSQFRSISGDDEFTVLYMQMIDKWLNRLLPNQVYIAFGESSDSPLADTDRFTILDDVVNLRRNEKNYKRIINFIAIIALPGAIALPLIELLLVVLPESGLTFAAFKFFFYPAFFLGFISKEALNTPSFPLWILPAYYGAWLGFIMTVKKMYLNR